MRGGSIHTGIRSSMMPVLPLRHPPEVRPKGRLYPFLEAMLVSLLHRLQRDLQRLFQHQQLPLLNKLYDAVIQVEYYSGTEALDKLKAWSTEIGEEITSTNAEALGIAGVRSGGGTRGSTCRIFRAPW